MREFVQQQTGELLKKFAVQLSHAARAGEVEAIHDLRVAIRRLNRCLRVFSQFYPGRDWKKLRRRLKGLMDACGAVRDRDIAIELLTKGGFPATSIVIRRLHLDRAEALEELLLMLRRWKRHGAERKLRAQLGL